MDRLTQRLQVAQRPLATLEEVVAQDQPSAIVRDAAIQRFEYSFEATWKAIQLYLQQHEGLQTGSPKRAIRAAFQTGLLDETQSRTALRMADDRNRTVHTYNEELAQQIYAQLESYWSLMNACSARMLPDAPTAE